MLKILLLTIVFILLFHSKRFLNIKLFSVFTAFLKLCITDLYISVKVNSWIQYLACTFRLVVADLILEVVFEDVSNAELLLVLMDAGQRVCDVDNDSAFICFLHSECHSTDVTWGEDTPTMMRRLPVCLPYYRAKSLGSNTIWLFLCSNWFTVFWDIENS